MSEDSISTNESEDPILVLSRWDGALNTEDPDANFKDEVRAYGLLDPLITLSGVAASLDIPVGALARYVLAKWATGGSEGMLQVGGITLKRMQNICHRAEHLDTKQARLDAYDELRQIVDWLNVPIKNPELYE